MTTSCYIWFDFYCFSILGTTEIQVIPFLPIIIERFMIYNFLVTLVHYRCLTVECLLVILCHISWYVILKWIIFSQIIKSWETIYLLCPLPLFTSKYWESFIKLHMQCIFVSCLALGIWTSWPKELGENIAVFSIGKIKLEVWFDSCLNLFGGLLWQPHVQMSKWFFKSSFIEIQLTYPKIHPLEIQSSVVFTIFTKPCNYHH